LPGKVLKKIRDKTILDYVIDRLKFCKNIDDIILATTTDKKDDVLEKYAINKEINYFRGSEEDVLSRYYEAAKKYHADTVVRITSDCPLIDPEIVDEIIKKHIGNEADYTSNTIKRTYPRGLDTEVFNFNILEEAYKHTNEKYHREHVTPYIREHPERFKLQNIEAHGKIKRPDIRITVDTKEDFELMKKIILHFDDLSFKTESVIDFLDRDPELMEINKNVKQKRVKSN
jgi:spore coat polysaccharide biosynthesis protein SpsF